MLRVSLWNTYGKEELVFESHMCHYTTNYGWFKDKVQSEEFSAMSFSINPVGYLEDNQYTLVIEDLNTNQEIMCVTKLPETVLEQLISELKNMLHNS